MADFSRYGRLRKAEVTAGGADTNELSSHTMEGKEVPGRFFIGEVVDVTGHLIPISPTQNDHV
jgi:predicted flavoprotein YhiN